MRPRNRSRWTFFSSRLQTFDFLHNKRQTTQRKAAPLNPHACHGNVFTVRPDNMGQFLYMADIINTELIVKRAAAVGIRNKHNLAAVKRMLDRGAAEADMGLYEFFQAIRPAIFAYLKILWLPAENLITAYATPLLQIPSCIQSLNILVLTQVINHRLRAFFN